MAILFIRIWTRRKCWNIWTFSILTLSMIFIWYIYKNFQANMNCTIQFEKVHQGLTHHHNIQIGKKTLAYEVQVIRPLDWSELKNSFNVCLATQTTIDRLYTIGQVTEAWQGPISLAILIYQKHEINILKKYLEYLKSCHYWFNQTVSITIVLSNKLLDVLNEIIRKDEELINLNFDSNICEKFGNKSMEMILNDLQKLYSPSSSNNTSSQSQFIYPQNHVRNIARKNCETDWIFLTDVDLIPKNNSASLLQEFYESDEAKSCQKCAFVVPTFSLNEKTNCSQPETKVELLDLWKKKLAEPFHFTSWNPAQRPTNYQKWKSKYKGEGPVRISHKVNYNISSRAIFRNVLSFYEPFYISSNSIPLYDTRFIGYGFTRSSQAFESIVAGWTFYVLTPIYITHCGVQARHEWNKHPKNPRHLQIQRNKPIYQLFSKMIWMKYRNSRKL